MAPGARLPDVAKLLRQAEGRLTSAFACLGEIAAEPLGIVSSLWEFIRKGNRCQVELLRKRMEYEAGVPDVSALYGGGCWLFGVQS